MSTDKTLADVQPGGRVRLGDQAELDRLEFQAWARWFVAPVERDEAGDYVSDFTRGLWCAWQAALSAQPSPGGQGVGVSISDDDRAVLQRLQDALPTAGINGWAKGVEVLERLLRDSLACRQPVRDQHPDDLAVDAFAAAMKAKMAEARAKGRGGWEDPSQCNAEDLSRMLRDHVEKGDPRDVANFCMMLHQRGEAIAARQPVGVPVAELREKGKRKVRAVVSQDDLHKILYLIHALKNISNKVWLKHDIHADDYRAATINDAAKVASGAIELLTRAYSALSGARADARVSRSAPGDAWIYADLNELSPHDVALLRDMRDHMAAKTMSLNDWHAFGPPVLDRVLALIDNDHAHRDAAPPAQAMDLAPDHRGMRVSCSGLLSQVRGGLKSNPELAEMVRQLHDHLNELGKRWYAGDRKVVDEFLQLYVIEDGARRALIDSHGARHV
ncbi:hypothetical protein [Stenotrophomonas maltophilia]|uniref:hypothetical protein n=1 Tax=Stenotrophomonas maltophilia TaxID=40324 RepID=UPI0039C445D8